MGRSRFNVPKLVWPVAITSAILLLLGIGGAWYVLQLQTAASDILAWNVTSIRAAEELEISVRELRNRLNRFLLSDDASQLTDVPQLQVLCQQWLVESARLGRSDREREFIRNIEIGMARLSDHLKRLRPELTHEETRKLVRELTDQGLWDQILKHSNEYLDFNERELATSSQHNQVLAERLALSLVMIGICGAAGGVLAGYGLARGIMRTIVQISLPIHDVAGQLDEVVGPISVSNMRHRDDLDQTLRTVSAQVTAVIERLHQREREALRAEQLAALGQLSAGLAHELRNPLMSMKILVQSAQSDDRGLLDGTDLDVLDDEIGRLETLVSTFLDFARPPDPAKRRINLGEILGQTLELVSRQARLRDVQLHLKQDSPAVLVEADAAQLRQVFLNLLLNSLDAARHGGDIWMEVRQIDATRQSPPQAIVEVADNGHGLSASLKETMFDPFVSSKSIGIGLGLTICRRIAEAHGGEITAEDRPGGGAIFQFRLPLTTADSTDS